MKRIKTVGFDADDTLWHNERFFSGAQVELQQVMRDFIGPDDLAAVLLKMQKKNVAVMGYGIKSFTLSMMDAALSVSDGKLGADQMRAILEIGREMMAHPVDLLPEVATTLEAMSFDYELVLITKGDLVDQQRKLDVSELGNWFSHVEIVSEKHPQTYETIFGRFGDLNTSVMVGNSVKSDVVPAVQAGAWGVHVPYPVVWELEVGEPLSQHDRYLEADDIVHARAMIEEI